MKKCDYCGHECPDDAAACTHCGTAAFKPPVDALQSNVEKLPDNRPKSLFALIPRARVWYRSMSDKQAFVPSLPVRLAFLIGVLYMAVYLTVTYYEAVAQQARITQQIASGGMVVIKNDDSYHFLLFFSGFPWNLMLFCLAPHLPYGSPFSEPLRVLEMGISLGINLAIITAILRRLVIRARISLGWDTD